jgi:hypothetical protein
MWAAAAMAAGVKATTPLSSTVRASWRNYFSGSQSGMREQSEVLAGSKVCLAIAERRFLAYNPSDQNNKEL